MAEHMMPPCWGVAGQECRKRTVKPGLCLLSPSDAGGEDRGKLSNWIAGIKKEGIKVRGVLCTTVDGKRNLTRISSGETRLLQLNEVSAADHEKMTKRRVGMEGKITADNAEMISGEAKEWAERDGRPFQIVGPYVFDEEVLRWAREELEQGISTGSECLVVDEAGPLELKKGGGLEPVLSSRVMPACQNALVLVVVRDSLRQLLLDKASPDAHRLVFPPASQAV